MRMGIIACSMLRQELEQVLVKVDWQPEIVYLDAALHIKPQNLRAILIEEIKRMAAGPQPVDAVFLGYGFCQSLEGIDRECPIPVILPQVDDCIVLLLGPERYAAEVKKEAGTWFMTPAWAEVSAEMVIKELHLDRATRYGKDPMEMAKHLFTHYRRGLYIDTGVDGQEDKQIAANKFCEDFNLVLEQTTARPNLLEQWVQRARNWQRA